MSAAPKQECDLEKEVAKLEAVFGTALDMDGARTKSWKDRPDTSMTVVERVSRPIGTGRRTGSVIVENFTFKGCVPYMALLDLYGQERKSHTGFFFRGDGSLQASCDGDGFITVENSWSGLLEANPNCSCFDHDGSPREPGEFGCADPEDVEYIREFNDNRKKELKRAGRRSR